jgi:hypothetical protein
MNKNIFFTLSILIVLGIGLFFVMHQNTEESKATLDTRNVSFVVDGKLLTLVNGVSDISIENSSAHMTTRYFGNEATGDLNGDGLEDRAFLVTQSSGGSGTFYYVVVALGTDEGYKITNAFFVGDRIAPQSTEIHSDARELHVNYADRKKGEPMTAEPSLGKVLLLKVTPSGILEGLMT